MENNIDFETYLFISPKKLIISVNSESNKKIYEEELKVDQDLDQLDYKKLDYFLNENIFKIEKYLKDFVKKIFVIIDLNQFFTVKISVKKNSYENYLYSKNLNYLLNEAKDCCKETIDKMKIIHMVIENYQINDKSHSSLPKNFEENISSIDVKFICLSNVLIRKIEEILRKYQISINQLVSANYIHDFLTSDEKNMFIMTKRILEGQNPNEVLFTKKINKNRGFFEKFFNFFS